MDDPAPAPIRLDTADGATFARAVAGWLERRLARNGAEPLNWRREIRRWGEIATPDSVYVLPLGTGRVEVGMFGKVKMEGGYSGRVAEVGVDIYGADDGLIGRYYRSVRDGQALYDAVVSDYVRATAPARQALADEIGGLG